MNEKERTRLSKFMSRVLRHEPSLAGISLDNNGWADIDELLKGANRKGFKVVFADLKEVVILNDKQRFKFSDDMRKIRASQGYSVKVDVELREEVPPEVLYHGTASKFVQDIKNQGLIAKSRLYVHLSADRETATRVGMRHGKHVVMVVNAEKMRWDGFVFYLSDNGVWLTERVPPEYIWS